MRLSETLVAIAQRLSAYSASGLQLEPAGVAALVLQLDELAGEARLLEEGTPVWRVGRARATEAPPWGWGAARFGADLAPAAVAIPIDLGLEFPLAPFDPTGGEAC